MSFYSQYPASSSGSNASVGGNGAPIPSSSTEVGAEDPSGNLQPLQVDATGALLVNLDTETAGLATAANQVLEIAELQDINSNTADVATETTLSALNAKVVAVNTGAVVVASSALPAGAATEASLSAMSDKTAAALVPEAFDYQLITYVGATSAIDQVVYKLGGSGGTTVATLTMAYDGSSRLSTVTKS